MLGQDPPGYLWAPLTHTQNMIYPKNHLKKSLKTKKPLSKYILLGQDPAHPPVGSTHTHTKHNLPQKSHKNH